jgi:hypothetical protein
MNTMKCIVISTIALCCLPLIAYAAVITLDEGGIPTSRADVPANTFPGDVILCDSALNAAGTDCVNLADRSDIIFINTRNFGGGHNADLYSDPGHGEDFSDRTRINVNAEFPDPLDPTRPLFNTIALLESSVVGVLGIPYAPNRVGQAGFFFNGVDFNSYVFISDIEPIPEPGSLALLGSGLLLAGIVYRRRPANNFPGVVTRNGKVLKPKLGIAPVP